MFQIRGPTWRTTAPGDGCPILQMEMVMAVGYTKPRVVPDSSLKWRNKCASCRQSLEKEAKLWRLCPHQSLSKLDSGCQRAWGKWSMSTEETWDKEPQFLRARLWSSMLMLAYLVSCERRKRQVSHTEGMLPEMGWISSHPHQLPGGCFALNRLNLRKLLSFYAQATASKGQWAQGQSLTNSCWLI